jgi:hypothetical protein
MLVVVDGVNWLSLMTNGSAGGGGHWGGRRGGLDVYSLFPLAWLMRLGALMLAIGGVQCRNAVSWDTFVYYC